MKRNLRIGILSFGILLCLSSCIEKELLRPEGTVRLVYDWGQLAGESGSLPENMVAYFYPQEAGREPVCVEVGAVSGDIELPRGTYRMLTFNSGVRNVGFEGLDDFEGAKARLQTVPAKSPGGEMFFAPGWLFGGTLEEITIGNNKQMELKVKMQSYVKRVKIMIETEVSVVDTSFGSLDNVATGVQLKDGKVISAGNGTIRFELNRTERGLAADFAIFGVAPTAASGETLKNNLHLALQDPQGNRQEFVLDVTGKLGNVAGNPLIEEEIAGLGVVKITVGDWVPDDEDNSVSETQIRLAAFTGIPARSGLAAFAGTFGVYVAGKGQAPGTANFYKNVRVEAPGGGMSQTMYYPTGKNVDIYAYAPFEGTAGTAKTTLDFTLAPAVTEAELQRNDFLWAGLKNQVATSGELPLVFNHCMSQLEVQVIRGVGISDTLDFTATTVEILNLCGKATIQLADGTVTADAAGSVQTIVPVTMLAEADMITVKAIVIPQMAVAGKNLLRVCVGGPDGQPYIYKPAAPLVFRSGYRQVLKLTLKGVSTLSSRSGGKGTEWTVSEEKW